MINLVVDNSNNEKDKDKGSIDGTVNIIKKEEPTYVRTYTEADIKKMKTSYFNSARYVQVNDMKNLLSDLANEFPGNKEVADKISYYKSLIR